MAKQKKAEDEGEDLWKFKLYKFSHIEQPQSTKYTQQ